MVASGDRHGCDRPQIGASCDQRRGFRSREDFFAKLDCGGHETGYPEEMWIDPRFEFQVSPQAAGERGGKIVYEPAARGTTTKPLA